MNNPSAQAVANPAADQPFNCSADQGFTQWLSNSGGSLLVTTYQAGKVLLAGWNGQQVTMLLRHFNKPMGIAVRGDQLALATRDSVLMFANSRELAVDYMRDQPGKYDSLFVPRMTYHTGELHLHDLAFGDQGLWAVNTRFSSLGFLSDQHSFVPKWRPRFVTEFIPEDRCHLNGLAMRDGKPAFVSVLGETNEPGAWRENKANGGALIDVESGETVIRGLTMPHSPRWHEGKLWFLNSGAGELCVADIDSGTYEVVARYAGYLRGLHLDAKCALVGMSKIRERHIFGGMPVEEKNASLHCGVSVTDLSSGGVTGRLDFTSGCSELYDVHHLPGVYRPNLLNLDKEITLQAFSTPEHAYWMRPENFQDVVPG